MSGDIEPGRPVVLRGGTVLTMNDAHDVLHGADVLVVGEEIAGVGPSLEVPDGAYEIDASDGIVMPGMIDTHRHMWQTALRGYGADWTLAQYFVFFYLEYGKIFRPQDIYAGNLLSAIESLEAGVTTTVDWSHGLQTVDHADAAVDALEAVPGRFVLAYGNIQQGPWEWSTSADFRSFVERRFGTRDDMLGFQMAFDVTGDPAFPEQEAFKVARELGVPVTTHAGVWGATNDDGIRLMHEHGFMTPESIYVHAATLTEDSYHRIAATGGSVSVSTESEQSAGQGYPPTWALRKHDIPVSLSMDTSVWWSGDLFCAMRSTLGADRSREHLEAHAQQETVTNHHLRAEQVVDWATRGGSKALRLDSLVGSLEAGKKADVVLVKNDDSPVMFPVLHPYGHVAFQAQRGDVHTVLVNGSVVKHEGKLVGIDLAAARRAVEETVEFAQTDARRRRLGERDAPGDPRAHDPRESVPVHRVGEGRREASARRGRAGRAGRAPRGAREHRVTEEEWHAALAFLTEVGRADEFVLLSDVTRTSVLIDTLSHGGDDSGATASDVEGPMYTTEPPFRTEDLRGVRGDVGRRRRPLRARHDHLDRGRRRSPRRSSTSGRPGPAGGYDVWDERQPEGNFRGRIRAGEDGAYEFQTMLPKPYTVPTDRPDGRYLEAVGQHPWRPAHIHFKVTAPGHHTLITQVFFPDDPYLENDTIGAVKPALVRPVEPEDDHLTCDFDIALRPAA